MVVILRLSWRLTIPMVLSSLPPPRAISDTSALPLLEYPQLHSLVLPVRPTAYFSLKFPPAELL